MPDGPPRVFVSSKLAFSAGYATSDAEGRRMSKDTGNSGTAACCRPVYCPPLLRSCKHAKRLASQRCAVCLAYCQGTLCSWEGPVIGQQCMHGRFLFNKSEGLISMLRQCLLLYCMQACFPCCWILHCLFCTSRCSETAREDAKRHHGDYYHMEPS